MEQAFHPAFDAWFAAARTLDISNATSVRTAASENMIVLEVPKDIPVRDLGAAIARMVASYRDNASAAKKSGLVYVWADEMSGTLRCSFCEVASFEELPFRRALVRATSADDIALLATEHLSDVISYDELTESSSSDATEPPPRKLAVFASAVDT